MTLFDTHCHINDEQFDLDRADVIARMREAGVARAVVVGDGARDPSDAFRLADENDFLFAAAGVHPHDASLWTPAREGALTACMAHKKAVALGEIGLDYHYDLSPREAQKDAFDAQLDLAYRLEKPVILHIREAHGDAADMLLARARTGRMPRGVMHCYTGSWESAKTYLSLGLYISFSGAVTFKNAPKLWEVAQNMPLERILIETDCPYMAPVPMRGKRNEPAYVRYVLEKIANIRGLALEEAARVTYENGLKAFA